jgi:flavin-dependent dehydrogenase
MIRCDALIAGGGPAGLAAAIALRQKGLDVLVVEALQPPADKACGEGLMPDAHAALAKLGIALGSADGHRFTGISFCSPRHRADAQFPGAAGIGVRRTRLHSLLAERCHQIGVRLAWGQSVAIRLGEPVQVAGERCRYAYIVGADGQSSRVRSWAGLAQGSMWSRRFGLRRHYRVAPWNEMVEVHWGDLGQAYVTPVAPNEVCVATVSCSSFVRMDAVLAGLPVLRRRLERAAVLSTVRGALTTTRRLRRVCAEGVALIGDASGSADAVTGQGIALCFRQAELLAQAVRAGDLARYAEGHTAILRLSQSMARWMLCMDRFPWLRDRTIAAFSREPEIFRNMLAAHLGEEPFGRFLLRGGPHLAWQMLLPPRNHSLCDSGLGVELPDRLPNIQSYNRGR